ncbi:hypothetical protein JG687_00013033 [Phytophthora cactorum]|uniref:Uncharacterized protein n=1 Tax=Phytophthora cactorum TaxID=29920 RepID=A0A8T1U2W2_9STRA|nr:hypothetical protein JG687_00013033 [Phytophthora cactorum]
MAPDSDDLEAQLTALKAKKWTRGKDLTAHIKDMALRAGKRAVVKVSGGSYKKFVCSSDAPCLWLLNAVYSRPKKGETARFWYVTSGSLVHGPQCDSVARPTTRQLKESAMLRDAVYADARVSSADLVAQLEATQAFQCSKSMVYKAKTDLLDALEVARRNGDAEPEVVESMQKLPGYMEQLRALNAHVDAVIETENDQDESEERSTTGVEMQHTSYNGTMLVLIGQDGDLQPLLHAAALVPEESIEHCKWFLEKLIQHGFPLRRFPVDMREGRKIVLEEEDEALVWKAQRAEVESEYLASVAQLSRQNEAAAQYIRGVEPAQWCLYPYLAMRKMYGWKTTRFEQLDLDMSVRRSGKWSAA